MQALIFSYGPKFFCCLSHLFLADVWAPCHLLPPSFLLQLGDESRTTTKLMGKFIAFSAASHPPSPPRPLAMTRSTARSGSSVARTVEGPPPPDDLHAKADVAGGSFAGLCVGRAVMRGVPTGPLL